MGSHNLRDANKLCAAHNLCAAHHHGAAHNHGAAATSHGATTSHDATTTNVFSWSWSTTASSHGRPIRGAFIAGKPRICRHGSGIYCREISSSSSPCSPTCSTCATTSSAIACQKSACEERLLLRNAKWLDGTKSPPNFRERIFR